MKISRSILQLLLVLLVSVSGSCNDREREITETEVPAAVLQAFKKAYPTAVVRVYEVEIDDGKRRHEINFIYDGRNIDALYDHDGTLLELDETLSEGDLPSTIRDGLSDMFDMYEIEKLNRVTKRQKTTYEIELFAEINGTRKKRDLVFSQDGTLIDD